MDIENKPGQNIPKNHKATYTCPKCEHDQEFQHWDYVNAQLDPEMREKILDRVFYTQTCEECGAVTQVLHSFMYHDMENQLLVYVVAESDPEKQAAEIEEIFELSDMSSTTEDEGLQVLLSSMKDNCTSRIVTSHQGLLEKIYISRNGLDDRLVEAMKVLYLSRLGDTIESKTLEGIYFDDVIDGGRKFVLDFADEGIATLDFDMDMYESLKDKMLDAFDAHTPQGFSIINYFWALGVLSGSEPPAES